MTIRLTLARWLLRGSGHVIVPVADVQRIDAICDELDRLFAVPAVFTPVDELADITARWRP